MKKIDKRIAILSILTTLLLIVTLTVGSISAVAVETDSDSSSISTSSITSVSQDNAPDETEIVSSSSESISASSTESADPSISEEPMDSSSEASSSEPSSLPSSSNIDEIPIAPAMEITPAAYGVGATYNEQFPNDPIFAALMAGKNNTTPDQPITALAVANTKLLEFPNKGISDISGIEVFVNINRVELRNNEITSIPATITSLAQLSYLDLSGNNISSIPTYITDLTMLSYLNVSDNNISTIPVEITSMDSLKMLYLQDNNITVIPKEVGSMDSLQLLHLAGNAITSIPKELGNMDALTHLHLTANNITAIPAEIGNLTTLTSLHFGENQITSIPASIGNLTLLTTLTFEDNQITVIPPSLYNTLASTKILYVRAFNNNIIDLPPEIYNLSISEYRFAFQTYSQTISHTGYTKEAFAFNALPVHTQSKSYVPAVTFTYALTSPSGTTTDLTSTQYSLANGIFTLKDAALLQQEGSYTVTSKNANDVWEFKQTFQLAARPSNSDNTSGSNNSTPSSNDPPSSNSPSSTSSTSSSSKSSSSSSSSVISSITSSGSSSPSVASSPGAGTGGTASPGGSASSSSPSASTPTNGSSMNNQEKRETVREQLIKSGVPTVRLGNTQVPLTANGEMFVWSLLSLILMIGSAAISVYNAIKMFIYNRKGYDNEHKAVKLTTVILGFVSLVTFFIVYNLNSLMVIVDARTILFALILAGEIICMFLSKIKRRQKIYSKQ